MVHSEVCLNKYVVSIAPFSTPACPDCSQYIKKTAVFACFRYLIFHYFFQADNHKKTWKEVVREDCQARKLNKEDAVDRCKWRKVIKEAR